MLRTGEGWALGLLACALYGPLVACGETPADNQNAPPAAAPKPPQPAAAPAPAPSIVHVVQEGETLWDIARAYGVTVEQIQAANDLDQRAIRRLSKNTQLRIPGASQPIDVLAAK